MGNKLCCEEVNQDKQDKIIIQVQPPIAQTGNIDVKSSIKDSNHNQPNINAPLNPDTLLVDSKRSQVSNNNSQIKPKVEYIPEPILSQQIQENLQKHNPFYNQINSYANAVKIGSKVYRGQLNQAGAHGYGKMYYQNGSVLVGKFVDGVPHGPAHYVWPDGSFYQGNVENGKASDTIGNYVCDDYSYKGSIKNNSFDGEGTLQSTKKRYKFTGYFQDGKRKYGKLTWKQTQRNSLPLSSSQVEYDVDYSYEGNFDNNQQFTGRGTLEGPKGVYKGQFKNGLKNGQGIFQYKSGLRYEGTYKDGVRDGKGVIYSKTKTISYDGEFKNGIPHGKGKAPGVDGKMYEVIWKEGVTSEVLQDSYTPAKKLN